MTVDRGIPGVLRSKGFIWIASRPNECLTFSIAGGTTRMENSGPWLACYGARNDLLSSQPHLRDYIDRVWQGEYGDRRQEIVFIGAEMDRGAIEAAFDECLLTANEMKEGPTAWYGYEAAMMRPATSQAAGLSR